MPAPFRDLIKRIRSRFNSRRTEWLAALQSLLWGVALLLPGSTFGAGQAFIILQTYLDENFMGIAMVLLGLLRMAGLIVNGARKEVTPWIRVFSALVGCGVFAFISLAFAASGVWSVWIAAWPVAAIGELFNIHNAMRDARLRNG